MFEKRSQLAFNIIREFREANIAFTLNVTRDDAITILAVVPGQRWEIDVFEDGTVDVEVFQSNGELHDVDRLQEMIMKFKD
jgi:hypothetical protein